MSSGRMARVTQHPFGIDFGGTGIKGAPVDLDLASSPPSGCVQDTSARRPRRLPRYSSSCSASSRRPPPVGRDRARRSWSTGRSRSAANIDPTWIDTDADALFTEATGRDVHVVNDADAAGLAEARYGAARGVPGLVIVTTLGTGIGSAMINDGRLVPNSELGHLEIDGHDAESRAANSAREREDLTWEQWAERLTTYYAAVEALFSPDLFVVGGGVSKHAEEFLPLVRIRTRIIPATLLNRAGVVGAALYAAESGD